MLDKRFKRHRRVRAKIKGTNKIPRLCIFRSKKHIYGQLIDDEKGRVLLSVADKEINKKSATAKTQKQAKVQKELDTSTVTRPTAAQQAGAARKVLIARKVGKLIAKRAIEKGIKKVVFDRAGYKYHGRVKTLAEGAREGGLKF